MVVVSHGIYPEHVGADDRVSRMMVVRLIDDTYVDVVCVDCEWYRMRYTLFALVYLFVCFSGVGLRHECEVLQVGNEPPSSGHSYAVHFMGEMKDLIHTVIKRLLREIAEGLLRYVVKYRRFSSVCATTTMRP